MGFRFRRSIKICSGVRLNFSKSGPSLSLGTRGAHYTIGSNGRRTTSFGIPGTGLYYTDTENVKRKAVKRPQRPTRVEADLSPITEYQDMIKLLTTVHTGCSPVSVWQKDATSEPPFSPQTDGPLESKARKSSNRLKPNLWERLFPSRYENRKRKAEENISRAEAQDEDAYKEWEAKRNRARKVLAHDEDACLNVIADDSFFTDFSSFGSDYEFTIIGDAVSLVFTVNAERVFPTEKPYLSSAGNILRKQLTKTEQMAIIQDYVCSTSIRLARELFALLPLSRVLVNAKWREYDKDPILSVIFDREKFSQTDFDSIDASDYTTSFPCRMDYLQTKGFRPVKALTLARH